MSKFKYRRRRTKNRTLRVKIAEFLDNLRYFYWHCIPHEYRPIDGIWYRFKCWAWYRYSTVKPKSLPHTWVDRTELLPHCIFQILSDFIEKECNPGHINWYYEEDKYPGYKIIPGLPYNNEDAKSPGAVWVRDEMQYLYDWWNNTYLKEVDNCFEDWHSFQEENTVSQDWDDAFVPVEDSEDKDGEPQLLEWVGPKFKEEGMKEKAHELWLICNQKEEQLRRELEGNMVRVVYLTPFLWT